MSQIYLIHNVSQNFYWFEEIITGKRVTYNGSDSIKDSFYNMSMNNTSSSVLKVTLSSMRSLPHIDIYDVTEMKMVDEIERFVLKKQLVGKLTR
jgi:hypothetical protein